MQHVSNFAAYQLEVSGRKLVARSMQGGRTELASNYTENFAFTCLCGGYDILFHFMTLGENPRPNKVTMISQRRNFFNLFWEFFLYVWGTLVLLSFTERGR